MPFTDASLFAWLSSNGESLLLLMPIYFAPDPSNTRLHSLIFPVVLGLFGGIQLALDFTHHSLECGTDGLGEGRASASTGCCGFDIPLQTPTNAVRGVQPINFSML